MARLPRNVSADGPIKGLTKEENETRAAVELAQLGAADELDPPFDWCEERKQVYHSIIRAFPNDSLCNLDVPLLQELAISLHRKHQIDARIDLSPGLLEDSDVIRARKHLLDSATRCMKDLGMSRTSRAQIADRAASAVKNAATVFDIIGD